MATKTTSKKTAAKTPSAKPAKPTDAKAEKAAAKKPAPVTKDVRREEPRKDEKPASLMSEKDRNAFKNHLLKLREKVTGHISFLADDTLNRVDDTPTEDRTDDFDREFALNLVSSEHDALFEIDEALRRLEEGRYGVCESCSKHIERPRLQALPFAKMCVSCQTQNEKGRTKFRPFGATIYQTTERSAEGGPAGEEPAPSE